MGVEVYRPPPPKYIWYWRSQGPLLLGERTVGTRLTSGFLNWEISLKCSLQSFNYKFTLRKQEASRWVQAIKKTLHTLSIYSFYDNTPHFGSWYYSCDSVLIFFTGVLFTWLLGSLRNYDDEGNENGEKSIVLDQQNNNFARASRLFVQALPSLHDYNGKLPKFTFGRGREQQLFFSFPKLWCSPLEFNSKNICEDLTN